MRGPGAALLLGHRGSCVTAESALRLAATRGRLPTAELSSAGNASVVL